MIGEFWTISITGDLALGKFDSPADIRRGGKSLPVMPTMPSGMTYAGGGGNTDKEVIIAVPRLTTKFQGDNVSWGPPVIRAVRMLDSTVAARRSGVWVERLKRVVQAVR